MMIYTFLLQHVVDLAWKNATKVGFAFDRSLSGVQERGLFNREDYFLVIELSFFSSSFPELFILDAQFMFLLFNLEHCEVHSHFIWTRVLYYIS